MTDENKDSTPSEPAAVAPDGVKKKKKKKKKTEPNGGGR